MSQTNVPLNDETVDQVQVHDAERTKAPRRAAHPRRRPHARMPVAERRAALVEAATQVIARDGIRGASTRAIVGEAGMSLASFHYAFASHDELMREVISEVLGREVRSITRSLAGTIDTSSSVPALLRAALDAFVDAIKADPSREKAVFELHQYATREPELNALVVGEYAAYYDAAERILLGVAAATGTRWTRPVDELARYVITVTDGFTMAWLTLGDEAALPATRDIAVSALLTWNEPNPGPDAATAE
jgi:AcrR family transcriptional regulator